jgi:16S rRNA (guanine1207-N2)-methyltransferase
MASSDHELHHTSQLLVRHLEAVSGSRILVVGYPQDHFIPLLQQRRPHASVVAFTFDYATHQYARAVYAAAGLDLQGLIFGAHYTPADELHDTALVFLPKGRDLTELTLAMTANALALHAPVFLVGETDAGIRSSRPTLERLIGPVRTTQVGRHCVLYSATLAQRPPQAVTLDNWAVTYEVALPGVAFKVVSLPGVFSHGHLDDGTRFLLEHLTPQTRARVLDFGCGAGVIGAAVKKTWPDSEVDMVDTSALALEATRRTLLANDLPADSIYSSNIFSDVTGRYTHIISNPPFHAGIETDYRVVQAFLEGAAQHLEKGGRLTIVANRFLKYRPLMEQHVGRCAVVAENSRYSILPVKFVHSEQGFQACAFST